MKNNWFKTAGHVPIVLLVFVSMLLTPGATVNGDEIKVVHDSDTLYEAMKTAGKNDIIYLDSNIAVNNELNFAGTEIDVTLASATGNPVAIYSAVKYPSFAFNFNNSKVKIKFDGVTLDGNYGSSLLRFNSDNETLVLWNAIIKNARASGNGGALYIHSGSTELYGCVFENNKAVKGNGGAVYVGCGDAYIKNCSFINNEADYNGGGIYTAHYYQGSIVTEDKGNIRVVDCAFENNLSGGFGGALTAMGNVSVDNCQFLNNSAVIGGAIDAEGEECLVLNSTLDSNKAINLFADLVGPLGGGGIFFDKADVSIKNCVITNNSAANADGGGIYGPVYSDAYPFVPANITIESCVITDNMAPDGHGGGIYTPYENLENLTIDALSVLSGNTDSTSLY